MKNVITFNKRSLVPVSVGVAAGVLMLATLVQAATTLNTNIQTDGTLAATGAATLGAGVTVTGNTVTSGVASSTTLLVGNEANNTVSGIMFGYCTIPATNLTASTTSYASCAGATGVTSAYTVFVQATSSLPAQIIITMASSSAGAINVGLLNTGIATTTAGGIDPTSIKFWAFK